MSLGFLLNSAMAYPSPELLRQLGQAGVGLLIAYSVAIAAAGRELRHGGKRDTHLSWLGFTNGIGVCGLLGIGLAFGLAEHRDAQHANLVDDLGLWWIVSSIGMLGLVVACLPLATQQWGKIQVTERWRTDRLKAEASRRREPTR